jgi:hypothetical protein
MISIQPEQYREEIQNIINSINIVSDTTYIFNNHSYTVSPDQKNSDPAISRNQHKNYVVLHLQQILYTMYHCRRNRPVEHETSNVSSFSYSDSQDFIGALSENNSGHGTWESGWEIRDVADNGQLIVQKNGLILWIYPQQFISRDSVVDVGRKGYIRMVKGFQQLFPGFYMALGDAPENEIPDSVTVRLYWNIKNSYSALLMKLVTSELNTAQIPFRFKILNDPRSYPRADAAVLYIAKQYFHSAKKVILRIYERIESVLEPVTPLFSKTLYPGLALAEDPNNNESFGQHRCRIFAEAIVVAQQKNSSSLDQVISDVRAYFRALDLNFDLPYLNPRSIDDYDLLPNKLG